MAKPVGSEYKCRIRDSKDFDTNALQSQGRLIRQRRTSTKPRGKPYSVLLGKTKESGKWEAQGIRYPKSKWSKNSAKRHCKSHKGEKFEEVSLDPVGNSLGSIEDIEKLFSNQTKKEQSMKKKKKSTSKKACPPKKKSVSKKAVSKKSSSKKSSSKKTVSKKSSPKRGSAKKKSVAKKSTASSVVAGASKAVKKEIEKISTKLASGLSAIKTDLQEAKTELKEVKSLAKKKKSVAKKSTSKKKKGASVKSTSKKKKSRSKKRKAGTLNKNRKACMVQRSKMEELLGGVASGDLVITKSKKRKSTSKKKKSATKKKTEASKAKKPKAKKSKTKKSATKKEVVVIEPMTPITPLVPSMEMTQTPVVSRKRRGFEGGKVLASALIGIGSLVGLSRLTGRA